MRSTILRAALAALLCAAALPGAAGAAGMTLLSGAGSSTTLASESDTHLPGISADGHYDVFAGTSSDLVPGYTKPLSYGVQIFRRNLTTGAIDLVTAAAGTTTDGVDGFAALDAPPKLSADGRYVLFSSSSTKLVDGYSGSPGLSQVYWRDMQTGTTRLVSAAAGSTTAGAGGTPMAISADGQRVLFLSQSTSLVAGETDTNTMTDVFLWDADTGTTTLVSHAAGHPLQAAAGLSDEARMSQDGRYIAFVSNAHDVVPGLSASGWTGQAIVWRDMQAPEAKLVSAKDGQGLTPVEDVEINPAISRDGHVVVFCSPAAAVVAGFVDHNGAVQSDLFRRDMVAGTPTQLVSGHDGSATDGANAVTRTMYSAMSADGSRIAWSTAATDVVPGFVDHSATASQMDVYERTWSNGTPAAPRLVTAGTLGGANSGNSGSIARAMSADGRFLLISSNATDITTPYVDRNGEDEDLFRADLVDKTIEMVSRTGADGDEGANNSVNADGAMAPPALSDDGTHVVTTAAATNLVPGYVSRGTTVQAYGWVGQAGSTAPGGGPGSPGDGTPPPGEGGGTPGSTPISSGPPTGEHPVPSSYGAPTPPCPDQVVVQFVRLAGCFENDRYSPDLGPIVIKEDKLLEARGNVTMNGMYIVPDNPDTKIFAAATRIYSDGWVTIWDGGIRVHHGPLLMILGDATGQQEIASTPFTPPMYEKVHGLWLAGTLTPTFTRDGEARLEGPVWLPFGGNLLVKSDVRLVSDAGHGLLGNELRVHKEDLMVGPVHVRQVSVSYDDTQDIWRGDASLELPTPNRLIVAGGMAFQHGAFQSAYAEVDRLSFQITPGVFLQRIKLGLGVNPVSITGGVGVSAGPDVNGVQALRVDGDFTYTFGTPGRLRVDGRLQMANIPLAKAFFEYLTSGSVRFGGDFYLGLPDMAPEKQTQQPVYFHAFLDGFVDGDQFDAEAGAALSILKQDVHADLLASNKGLAACGEIGGWLWAGFGYTFATQDLTIMGPFACDVGDWRVFAPSDAVAAQAGAGRRIALGDQPVVLRLRGAGGAPKVTLHGPGGRTLAVPAGDRPEANADDVILQDPTNATTYVAIRRPGGGTWTVEPQAGSPAIRDIAGAPVLPKPYVQASVSGGGRLLRYRVAPRAGQVVTFVERGRGVSRTLGKARGAAGTIRVAPADGPGGMRKVYALVEDHGRPRARIAVARYRAPAPPAVAVARRPRLRVRHGVLQVPVTPGPGRVRRWIVQADLPSGDTRYVLLPKRGGQAKIRDFGPIAAARVTITAEAPDGTRGRAVTAVLGHPKAAPRPPRAGA